MTAAIGRSVVSERLRASRVIAVLRARTVDELLPVCDVLVEEQILSLEFTLTTPGLLDRLAELVDRYRAQPGDYANAAAAANIPGSPGNPTRGCTLANCGNGRIDDAVENESILAWHQLARAGFIIGSYDGIGAVPTPTNTPTNPFSGYLQIIYDNAYSDVAAPTNALNIKTGGNIPSPVIAELDRKIDDGLPETGALRFSAFGGSTPTCLTAAAPVQYNAAVDVKTCGASQLQ